MVPTPAKEPARAGVAASASITNTSRSGSEKGTAFDQSRLAASIQPAPFHLTMIPVSGAGLPTESSSGPGTPPGTCSPFGSWQGPAALKPSHTADSKMVVVWLPPWNTAA
jgi:hypothetical protein